MLERTYKANKFEDALAEVKKDLGPDAVIISSRQLSSGGMLGRAEVGDEVEVIYEFAVDLIDLQNVQVG